MSGNNTLVGSKIKGLRETKNLSIEEIAERSGLSVEQINSIENDQNLPSLGPLIKIARALGVRLGTFMDDNDALGPIVCRAADREKDSSISFSNDATDARKHMDHGGLFGCRQRSNHDPVQDAQQVERSCHVEPQMSK